METKLTLRLDEEIIRSAKAYAKENRTSVSRIVANYLSSLTRQEKSDLRISPIVKELSGIIPPDVDTSILIDEYHSYLQEKHR